jgi:predicted nucleic acid-binding protein
MKTVVSNTSPLRYLTDIGEPELLPQLFGKVLDAGEMEAIFLAKQKKADLLLIDEKKGRLIAKGQGLIVMGVLELANRQPKIDDFSKSIDKLLQTNIKISSSLIESMLNRTLKTG